MPEIIMVYQLFIIVAFYPVVVLVDMVVPVPSSIKITVREVVRTS